MNEPVSKCAGACCITGLACWCLLLPTALQALLVGAWLLVTGACCITGLACWCLLHYRPCLLVLGCLLPVLACVILIPYERTRIEVLAAACLLPTALQVRALLVLACVILIPYERTCIEVLAGACLLVLVTGACCITGSCLAGAWLCGTDTLRTNPYRSAYWCLVAVFWFLGINITVSYYAKRCIMLIFNNL